MPLSDAQGRTRAKRLIENTQCISCTYDSSSKSESVFDGLATSRDRGPPPMRRARAGAGRRPAAVSDN